MSVPPVVIPLQALPDQTVQAYLSGQNCTLRFYQRTFGLYMDMFVANAPLLYGEQCFNMNKLVRNDYYGFIGDIYFFDTDGVDDPYYTGLGSRYVLLYRPDL